MKWQPMPASARLPSGTRVEVLCGQPEQKYGARCVLASGTSAQAFERFASRARRWSQRRAWSTPRRSQALGDRARDQGRAMLAVARQQRRAVLVGLADHARALRGGRL